jgi:hypothetical protein
VQGGFALYHIEGHDIAKRYVAGFMSLDQTVVDENRAAAGGQTEHKGLVGSRIKGVDALFCAAVSRVDACARGLGVSRTNNVVCGVLRRSLRVVFDDQPPA